MPYANREEQRAYQRRWVAERRAAFFADKSCLWCGSTDRLELHHANPGRKVAHAIWSWGENRRLNEIGKCVVLCRGCHQRGHAEARRLAAELRNPCGTRQAYQRGCRCDACRRGNAEAQRCDKERARLTVSPPGDAA